MRTIDGIPSSRPRGGYTVEQRRRLMMTLLGGSGFYIPPQTNLVFDGNPDALSLSDGGSVTSFTDSSPGGNNLTVPGVQTAPTYKANIFGSHASVRFNGVANQLAKSFTLNQPTHVFLVAKLIASLSNTYMIDGGGNITMVLTDNNGAPLKWQMYSGTAFVPGTNETAVGVTFIVGMLFNGASSHFTLNGAAAISGNAGASNAGGLTLGGAAGATNFANYDLARILVYNADQTSQETNIISGLDGTYGAF